MRHHTTQHSSRATAAAQKLSCIGFCRIPTWTPRLERCTRGTSDLGLCNAKERVPKVRAQKNDRPRSKGVKAKTTNRHRRNRSLFLRWPEARVYPPRQLRAPWHWRRLCLVEIG
jgi:hypothetical protein